MHSVSRLGIIVLMQNCSKINYAKITRTSGRILQMRRTSDGYYLGVLWIYDILIVNLTIENVLHMTLFMFLIMISAIAKGFYSRLFDSSVCYATSLSSLAIYITHDFWKNILVFLSVVNQRDVILLCGHSSEADAL